MELAALLREVLDALEEARTPDDLRVVAFEKLFDVAAVPAGVRPAPAVGDAAAADTSTGSAASDDGSDDVPVELAKVAKGLEIPLDRVEDIFLDVDGELQANMDPLAFGPNTSDQARGVALLLVAARQIGGYDTDRTGIENIRSECKRLGIYDEKNFAKHLTEVSKHFNVNGSGPSRTFKIKPSGRQAAKEAVKKFLES